MTPDPRPTFAGPWRLVDLGNVVQWMRPVNRPTTAIHAGPDLYATYMGEWMLIGPTTHDRFPKCGGRPTIVTDTAAAGIGRLRSQCDTCGRMIEVTADGQVPHPAVT